MRSGKTPRWAMFLLSATIPPNRSTLPPLRRVPRPARAAGHARDVTRAWDVPPPAAGPVGRVTKYNSVWGVVFGRVIDHLNEPLSVEIDDSPFFAGAHGVDYGSTTSKHPSYHQDEAQAPASELRWFMDMMPFDGGNLMSPNPGATLISGQLYKYILYPTNPLTRKQLATLASSGGSSLLDVSGPGSVISDQPSDSYRSE